MLGTVYTQSAKSDKIPAFMSKDLTGINQIVKMIYVQVQWRRGT